MVSDSCEQDMMQIEPSNEFLKKVQNLFHFAIFRTQNGPLDASGKSFSAKNAFFCAFFALFGHRRFSFGIYFLTGHENPNLEVQRRDFWRS